MSNTLSQIVADLEAFAVKEWKVVEAQTVEIVQEIEPVVENGFALLVKQFGQLAVATVVNLMTSAGAAMTGSEKLNLTATTVVDAAEKAGFSVLAADATALANNAYVAVMGTAPGAAK